MENNTDDQQLSSKKKLELFNNSVDKLLQETQVKNLRKLLHERYLEAKAKEEKEKEKKSGENGEILKEKTSGVKDKVQTNKVGKEFCRVFRLGQINRNNNNLRNRTLLRNHNRYHNRDQHDDIDPLLNDPNVLFENFAFDDDDDLQDANRNEDNNPPDLPYFPEPEQDPNQEEYEDDDSFKSLFMAFIRTFSLWQIIFFIIGVILYVYGQILANSIGWGGPYFIVATFIFIFLNLRRKSPGELSAYSVFNPNCRPIPTVSSNDQPRETIILYGQGL